LERAGWPGYLDRAGGLGDGRWAPSDSNTQVPISSLPTPGHHLLPSPKGVRGFIVAQSA
jgi:hypothetical protein